MSFKDTAKGWLAWLYEWITVLTASITGTIATAFEVLDAIGAVDLTAFMPAPTALKITTMVAILKGLWTVYRSKTA